MKKYILTNPKFYGDEKYFQIKAIRDFSDVKKGDLGGYVHSKSILSHNDNCWIYLGSRASEKTVIIGNVKIINNSFVQNACFRDDVIIDNSSIYKGFFENNVKIINSKILIDATFYGDFVLKNSYLYNNNHFEQGTISSEDNIMSFKNIIGYDNVIVSLSDCGNIFISCSKGGTSGGSFECFEKEFVKGFKTNIIKKEIQEEFKLFKKIVQNKFLQRSIDLKTKNSVLKACL